MSVWGRNQFLRAPCLLWPTWHFCMFCMFCHLWLTWEETAKCFLPPLSSTQELKCVNMCEGQLFWKLFEETFPGGLCLCISSETPSAPALHPHRCPMVVDAPGMAAANSRCLPKHWKNFLPENNTCAKPQELLLAWGPRKPKWNWKSRNWVGTVRPVGSRQLLLAELPPSAFSAGRESCRPGRWLFPSHQVDVPGMSNVEPLCKSLEHHPSRAAAPPCTFPPPFPSRSTSESSPISRYPGAGASTGTSAFAGSPKRVRNETWLYYQLMRAVDWAYPALPQGRRGCFRLVWVHRRGARRQRCLAGPAAAVRRRRPQLQSWFENFKWHFSPPFFFMLAQAWAECLMLVHTATTA